MQEFAERTLAGVDARRDRLQVLERQRGQVRVVAIAAQQTGARGLGKRQPELGAPFACLPVRVSPSQGKLCNDWIPSNSTTLFKMPIVG